MIRIMSTEAFRSGHPRTCEPELARFDKRLLAAARELKRPAGATLFRTGERPASMFYVLRGEAVMQRVTRTGASVVLQRASHAFLAEASLTSVRYHCDSVCRRECDLLVFPIGLLRKAIDSDEGTRWAWVEMLSAQSRHQRARIERLMLNTIRERLMHLLLTEGEDGSLDWNGTRMELAAELGVTPEALYRALATFKTEGLLSVQGSRLSWLG
jgi:CRP-like cAMP-binding protein